MECPDEQALAAYGRDPAGQPEVERHVGDCAVCSAVLAELLEAPGERSQVRQTPRYRVTGFLGEGASGRVFLAQDQVLARKVALKVRRWGATDDAAAREAALHEARSLAAVSSPYVVQVFDCFDSGDGLVLAMEYVPGESLRARLGRPARREELQALLLQAGAGLAAVHQAGLVHGDFKPENVLLGSDGRVRVADFGLASLGSGDPIRGLTPAYAAPEVVAGARSSPASDQYAFCVCAWEALTGRRPQATADDARGLPRRWRALLRRGLEAAPADRFASMQELVEGLGQPWWRPRHPARVMAAVSLVLLAAVAGAAVRWWRGARCRDEAGRVVAAWSPQRAGAVRSAFAGAGVGGETFEAFDRGVRAFAAGWRAERLAYCERGASEEVLVVGECLDEQAELFEGLTRVYASPTRQAALDAPRAALTLPNPAGCRAAVGPLRASSASTAALAGLLAAKEAGRTAELLQQVGEVRALAQKDGRDDVEARLELVSGQALLETGDAAAAEEALFRAVALAQRARQDCVAAAAWTQLARKFRLAGRLAEADRHLVLAEGQAPRCVAEVRVPVMAERAQLLSAQARFDEALSLQDDVQALAQSVAGAGTLVHLEQLRGRARILFGAERFEAAAAVETPLVAQYRALLGPRHLTVGKLLEHLAAVLNQLARFQEAEAHLADAAAIFTENLGEDAAPMIEVLANQAQLLSVQGQHEAALVPAARSVAIARQRLGLDSPRTTWAMGVEAVAKGRARRTSGAIEELQEALAHAPAAGSAVSAGFAADLALELAVAGRAGEAGPVLAGALATAGLPPRVETKLLAVSGLVQLAQGQAFAGAPRERLQALGTPKGLDPVFQQLAALVLGRAECAAPQPSATVAAAAAEAARAAQRGGAAIPELEFALRVTHEGGCGGPARRR